MGIELVIVLVVCQVFEYFNRSWIIVFIVKEETVFGFPLLN